MTTKEKVSHTPGPWLVMGNQRNGHFDYVLPESQNEEFQANCRLIAAAPELLEAARMVLDETNAGLWDCLPVEKLKAAIAKAEGR